MTVKAGDRVEIPGLAYPAAFQVLEIDRFGSGGIHVSNGVQHIRVGAIGWERMNGKVLGK